MKSKAIEFVDSLVQDSKVLIERYDSALTVRKRTVNKSSEALKGVKDLMKLMDRQGLSKRYVAGIYQSMVEQHQQHLSVLLTLKEKLNESKGNLRTQEFINDHLRSAV